jgi:hypothetical protein
VPLFRLGACVTGRQDAVLSPGSVVLGRSRPAEAVELACVGLPGSGQAGPAGARPGPIRPQIHSIRGASRFRFSARHTRFHSPETFVIPRIRKDRKPIADLIQPNGGSAMVFLRR